MPTLIQRHGISHITAGSNVARDNLNIQCPFCGSNDPSMHMGIRLSDGAWACWRDDTHRGRKPHRILRALFGWSWTEIDLVCGSEVDRDTMQDVVALLSTIPHPEPLKRLLHAQLPSDFDLIHDQELYYEHKRYLRDRMGMFALHGFINEYQVMGSLVGPFHHRILLPVRDQEGVLQTWTGRSIRKSMVPRYKTESSDMAVGIKSCLFHMPKLWEDGGTMLVVVEGPFDALKLDWYGREFGVRATCLFGSGCSAVQLSHLHTLRSRFQRLVVALDVENVVGTLKVCRSLVGLESEPALVPGRSDVGDLDQKAIQVWCQGLLRGGQTIIQTEGG